MILTPRRNIWEHFTTEITEGTEENQQPLSTTENTENTEEKQKPFHHEGREGLKTVKPEEFLPRMTRIFTKES